jgi:hypothetical protein
MKSFPCWFYLSRKALEPERFLIVAVILVLSFSLYQAFYFGLASFHNYSVLNMLKQWQNSYQGTTRLITREATHKKDYFQTKAKVQQVLLYHPNNAEYWDLSGKVHEWGYLFGYDTQPDALFEVKKQYLRATELRPFWPDSWGSLVKLKWRLQEFDEQMLFYFEQATQLGPQKPSIHLLVVELGLALYASNHPMFSNIRTEFHRRLALGLLQHKTRSRVRNLIVEYDLQTLVCHWLENENESIKKLMVKCQ